ncbi:MAG: peptidase M75 [Tannerella sp.]|nr:peptidase M75 [Tannerella sp.]
MKTFKLTLSMLLAAMLAGSAVSCSDDGEEINPLEEKDAALAPVIPQYVNNTVIVTYKALADATIDLCESLLELREDKTQARLEAAAAAWITTRVYWERSEAFLFGAVADFGIDPHIDTWPLDEPAFVNTLNSAGFIESMSGDDGDVWVAEHLGYSLLGFHGIEYILFEQGHAKNVASITDSELIYATAVGGDLRNQCIRLEASWAGIDNVTAFKRDLIEDLELVIMPTNSTISYGENMLAAGQPGSTYRTVTDAAVAILEGCLTISTEVGEVKIGTSYNKEDEDYIESPYSYNSKTDFIDNIQSIANAYLGGADETRRGPSVSDYVKAKDASLDEKVRTSILEAIAKIDAIPHPFAINYASPQAGQAMDACAELTAALEEAKTLLQQ